MQKEEEEEEDAKMNNDDVDDDDDYDDDRHCYSIEGGELRDCVESVVFYCHCYRCRHCSCCGYHAFAAHVAAHIAAAAAADAAHSFFQSEKI